MENQSKDHPTTQSVENHVCVCKVCKREFKSGSALGGHMRSHPNHEREVDPIKLEKSQHLESLSKDPSCHLCGKRFSSLKSLFGHMNFHPERDYRGIQPPQTEHRLSISSLRDESTVKMHDHTWKTKAKKGRLSDLTPVVMLSSSGDDDVDKVAYNLMMLAQGQEYTSSQLASKQKVNKSLAFESKKQRVEDLGPMVKYKCSTCNKCLPSYQALGGHISGHTRSKITNLPLAQLDLNVAPTPELEDNLNINATNFPGSTIFPTGLARGGQIRCHNWVSPMQDPLLSHATSSLSEKASRNGVEGGVRGFDLNELPSMEKEDGGIDRW